MKTWWANFKFFIWWHFKASENQKAYFDSLIYGQAWMKDGKRINPKDIFNGQ